LGYQDKVHLYGAEKTVATPGSQFSVLQTSLGKVGIMICYDGMFPESARTLALKGADLIFAPSRIGSSVLDPWIVYLRARALENRIPIIAPNVFRPPTYLGGSMIIDLTQGNGRAIYPKVVAFAGAGEKVILADVNTEQARKLRHERFLDRKSTAYFGR
jgi:predicted amidohydrolase